MKKLESHPGLPPRQVRKAENTLRKSGEKRKKAEKKTEKAEKKRKAIFLRCLRISKSFKKNLSFIENILMFASTDEVIFSID